MKAILKLENIGQRIGEEKWEFNSGVVTEIRGKTAFVGKAKGIIRVLKNHKEVAKVKEGDIIVVNMTTPDFIFAMEKAAAFITDEGGITCHASIIAREMRKPCIIGTGVATKVLKDGDIAEVDATKGIIRLIK